MMLSYNGVWTGLKTEEEQKREVRRLILEGVKVQTTRPPSKRYHKIGAGSSLQHWYGKRGWTKDRWGKIMDAVCVSVLPLKIEEDLRLRLYNPRQGAMRILRGIDLDWFIIRDGFVTSEGLPDTRRFYSFFKPGVYYVIRWDPPDRPFRTLHRLQNLPP